MSADERQYRDLAAFLIKARRHGYAGEGRRRKDQNFRCYTHSIGPWSYSDRYTGNVRDGGMECVLFEGAPIWTMIYYGGMTDWTEERSPIYAHLRQALQRPPPHMPCRGPAIFQSGDLIYTCQVEGDLGDFTGAESIFKVGRPCYRRVFAGGRVLDLSHSCDIPE